MGWHVRVEGKGARGMAQVVVNCSNGRCRCSGSSAYEQGMAVHGNAYSARHRNGRKILPLDPAPLHI